MNPWLNISDAAALALHAMGFLALKKDTPVSNGEIAENFGVSENHLSKVLQRLGKAGLVRSSRGPRGGYLLNRPAEEINLLIIWEAIEGSMGGFHCLLKKTVCRKGCIMGDLLPRIDDLMKEFLQGTTLSDIEKFL